MLCKITIDEEEYEIEEPRKLTAARLGSPRLATYVVLSDVLAMSSSGILLAIVLWDLQSPGSTPITRELFGRIESWWPLLATPVVLMIISDILETIWVGLLRGDMQRVFSGFPKFPKSMITYAIPRSHGYGKEKLLDGIEQTFAALGGVQEERVSRLARARRHGGWTTWAYMALVAAAFHVGKEIIPGSSPRLFGSLLLAILFLISLGDVLQRHIVTSTRDTLLDRSIVTDATVARPAPEDIVR